MPKSTKISTMASNQKTNPSLSVASLAMPKIRKTPLFETIDCQRIYSFFKENSPTSTTLITELISKNATYKTARESILKLYKKKDIKRAVDHAVGKFDLESVPENSHPKTKSGYIKLLEKHLDIALHPNVKEESSLNTHAHGWTSCEEDFSNYLESSGSFDNESKESKSSRI